jgi:transaldolase
VDGDISAEVVSTEAAKMVSEGRELSRIHKNVGVKCPLTRDGIMAASSRFVGRLDDIGYTGMDLIRGITQVSRNYGFKTQILAASLRSPTHVIDAAMAGAHIGAMPFKVLDMLFNHPLTDKGLEQFLKDWGKVFQETPVAG